jgi:uncharacterized protein YjbI with pentapeptide repeats
MTYADLSHANLEGADLAGVKLFRANLHRIREAGARIPDRRDALKPDQERAQAEDWQNRWSGSRPA